MGEDRSASVNRISSSLRMQHPIAHTVAFAAIARILAAGAGWDLGGIVLDDLGGIVRRAVVDHQDFGIPGRAADVSEHAVEGCANPCALVVGGNDDAVGGGHEQVVDR